jgi:hypothetical protein
MSVPGILSRIFYLCCPVPPSVLAVKGTVQRKLTGVESDINGKVFLSHLTADISVSNFKGTCSLNSKKAAKAKICGLFNSIQFNYPL